MKARQRLYWSAGRIALVAATDPRAEILYAGIGDEIPSSIADQFELVDGLLPGAEDEALENAILRVATIDGTSIEIAGLLIAAEGIVILSDQIDEAQLLALLEEPQLSIEAALAGGTKGWVPIERAEDTIEILKSRVAADRDAGRPSPLVGVGISIPNPGRPAVPDAGKRRAPAKGKAKGNASGSKQAAPGENKEGKGGSDKEAAPGGDKAPAAPETKGEGEPAGDQAKAA